MSKFYEVCKVLDKRTDTHGRVQFLVRWRGYGKKYDSWVDEADTNEHLKKVYRLCHQGSPRLLQTLEVLIAQKLNVKTAPHSSMVRRVSVSMPMDGETFTKLFSRLPSAPSPLYAFGNVRFSVPITELDSIMPSGWSANTFTTSTTCRIQHDKPVEVALLESKKVFFDHSQCLRCQGGDAAPIACKGVSQMVVYRTTVLRVSFYRERKKQEQKNPKERTRLAWAKPRASAK